MAEDRSCTMKCDTVMDENTERNVTVGKSKFHKSHHFDVCNQISKQVGEAKLGIGGEPRPDRNLPPAKTQLSGQNGSSLPTWIEFDRKVLSFGAFYQEAVHESKQEQFRVHDCKIYFYLEDDTIQVVELKKRNSGLNQGTIIKRHRISKPAPHDKEFYTLEDFNVGKSVNLYSKVFKIVECDPFTKYFMFKLGVRVLKTESAPKDPYTGFRTTVDDAQQPLRPYQKIDTLKQFLDHDKYILRFYCLWDDSDYMFGDPHKMILHYFLADDTIEIHEVVTPNSGRDTTPVFIKRGKLPKTPNGLPQPGQMADRIVLNVFGSMHTEGCYILESLRTGEVHVQYYQASDLRVGHLINVYGRPFLLSDCDNFTKVYYRNKYGITSFTPVEYRRGGGITVKLQYPPYNGFGSEEDSLSNCKSIIPKPPQKDFMKKDRWGLDSNVLRFLAKIESKVPTDKGRHFIISYFLSDDTISIFEPLVRNSGIAGGKFLERARIKKPDQPSFNTELSNYYLAQDLYIGQKVKFNNHQFILIDTDEYVWKYMEARPDGFPKSSVKLILDKIRKSENAECDQITRKFLLKAGENSREINYPDLASILVELLPDITVHEILVLARHYASRDSLTDVPTEVILFGVQEQLRKANYEDYDQLLASFRFEDRSGSGFLPPSVTRRAMLAQRIPVSKDLLGKFPTEEEKGICYQELVNQIDWQANPQSQSSDEVLDPNIWKAVKEKVVVEMVNYRGLLEELYPDQV